jgi:hypothetical protein
LATSNYTFSREYVKNPKMDVSLSDVAGGPAMHLLSSHRFRYGTGLFRPILSYDPPGGLPAIGWLENQAR